MNIQGNHICIRKFVLTILPVIYKSIRDKIPVIQSADKARKVPVNAKVKLTGETIYTCDVCPKTYVRKSNIKKHIQVKHAPAVVRDKVSSRPIPLEAPQILEKEISLEETVEVLEEIGPEPIEKNWECGECGHIELCENKLKEHMDIEHRDNDLQGDKIIYLVPENCKLCDDKEAKLKEYEAKIKEFEVLKRRHEQLKEKHDEAMKANKEYAKNVFSITKDYTEMKETAEKDAGALMDALSINQVLVEEVKIKDAMIKAQEEELKGMVKPVEKDTNEMVNEAPTFVSHITKKEVDEHMQKSHKNEDENLALGCNICDKQFPSQHSLKQHKTSKHKENNQLPVGHPERAYDNPQRMLILCVECGKRFSNGNHVDEHMKEHRRISDENDFEKPKSNKPCRYFRNGFCCKGEQCNYRHIEAQTKSSKCNRGKDCSFFQQNRCRFFHPGFGVQKPVIQNERFKKDCQYMEHCFKFPNCNFQQQQGFQLDQRQAWPPQKVNMKVWGDY